VRGGRWEVGVEKVRGWKVKGETRHTTHDTRYTKQEAASPN
jgi:hypothetical protein